MKINEIQNRQYFLFTVDGYGYNEGEDLPMDADDPIKKWHYMTTPEGERITLDHSPYQWMDQNEFAEYVAKHKALSEIVDLSSDTEIKLDQRVRQVNDIINGAGSDREELAIEVIKAIASTQGIQVSIDGTGYRMK